MIRYGVIGLLASILVWVTFFYDFVNPTYSISKIIDLQVEQGGDRIVLKALDEQTMIIIPPYTIEEDLVDVVPDKAMVRDIMHYKGNYNRYEIFLFSHGRLQDYEELSLDYATVDQKVLVVNEPEKLVVLKTDNPFYPYRFTKEIGNNHENEDQEANG